MKKLTDASHKLNAFMDLLRASAGLHIHARIRLLGPSGSTGEDGLAVEITGPDTPLLTARNGELLDAIEHIAARMLRLEPEERHRLSFDSADFKAGRESALRRLASDAVVTVRTTCSAYVFPPMISRDRRLLHLALASSGLKSASTGDHLRRSVVLYPEGVHPPHE